MNFSSILGVFAGLAVLATAVVTSSRSLKIFLDPHGILIVLGGTAAAGLMCLPAPFYFRIATVFISKFLGNYATRREVVINEIVDLARGYRENAEYLKQKASTLKPPFLADAVAL